MRSIVKDRVAWFVGLSVGLSVCLSVTCWYCVTELIIKSTIAVVDFRWDHQTEAPNTSRTGKINYFPPIFNSYIETEHDKSTITMEN